MSRQGAALRAAGRWFPFSHPTNQRSRPSRRAIAAVVLMLLALCGAGLAGYLALENLQGRSGVCSGVAHGCAAVQQSAYGKILGVPVSLPGLALYAVLAGLAGIAAFRPGSAGRAATAAAAYLSVAGAGFSLYLTGIEAFVLDAWCVYCIGSALLMAGLCAGWVALLLARGRPA